MQPKISRRNWMAGSAALAAASGQSARAQSPKAVVVSSFNGLAACKKAMEMLRGGADTLDAVIAGVNILELDPNETGVGYGGLPNEECVVELDASVMHGPSRRCGSVGGIQNVKMPSKVAKMVMEETDHIMLVGEGATKFAKEMGVPMEDLLTERSRLAWLVWKRSARDRAGHTNWAGETDAPPGKSSNGAALLRDLREQFPRAGEETLAWAMDVALRPPKGTINCMCVNSKGEMSGTTTTSGMAWKIAGRVGDSPLIGAGLFIDQDVGGGGSTGRGEENIRIAGGHTVVENMRRGMTPKEACLETLKRVSRNFNDDKARLARIEVDFYAVRKDGAYGAAALWSRRESQKGMVRAEFAVNDGGESRLEPSAYLYER
jgi:N4-(beta-N-acetylglucosaminyl)-L-asparaginase